MLELLYHYCERGHDPGLLAEPLNLASNLGSLGVFLALGSVHFPVAAVMVAGQIIGARLGSGLVIRKGAAFIRPVFLCVVAAMTLKLMWDAWRS